MTNIIQIIEEYKNNDLSFFINKQLLNRNLPNANYYYFILQRYSPDHIKKNTEQIHSIPFIKNNNTNNQLNFKKKRAKVISYYIQQFISSKKNGVLIINSLTGFAVSQELKKKINLKFLFVDDSDLFSFGKPEQYFHRNYKDENGVVSSDELQRFFKIPLVLAEEIICGKKKVKDYLRNKLYINPNKIRLIGDEESHGELTSSDIVDTINDCTSAQYIRSDSYVWRNYNFNVNAKDVLLDVKKVFDALKIDYWLDYGTLLGIVREENFIKHDLDIDIGMLDFDFSKKIEKTLEYYGFKKIKQYKLASTNKIVEQTFCYKEVNIDLFFYSKKEMKIYGYSFFSNISFENAMKRLGGLNTLETIFNFRGIELISFLNTYFPVPRDPVKYLSEHYGINYRIPNPNWNFVTDAFNSKQISEKGIYEEFY